MGVPNKANSRIRRIGFPLFGGAGGDDNRPQANNVAFTGTIEVGETLTGTYDYFDPNGQPESGTTYQWWRSLSPTGSGRAAIAGATAQTYEVQPGDSLYYISFGVTPSNGTLTGRQYLSAFGGPVPSVIPVASDVDISGTLLVGETLTGTYTYTDPNGVPESGTTLQWYRANTAGGSGSAAISGATNSTYVLTLAENEKYVRYGVTPSNGTYTGAEAFSAWEGPITAVAASYFFLLEDESGKIILESGDSLLLESST